MGNNHTIILLLYNKVEFYWFYKSLAFQNVNKIFVYIPFFNQLTIGVVEKIFPFLFLALEILLAGLKLIITT